MQHTRGVVSISEEFDAGASAESFTLSQIQLHGTPYVLLVKRDGRIYRADRRRGWRELVEEIGPFDGDRLPRRLTRLICDHDNPPAGGEATVALAANGVVVSVFGFEGSDELVVCSLWRVERRRPLEGARTRYSLTKREVELLERILQGESSNEIARILSLSTSTVEWHTKRLLLKTDSQNRTQLASRVLGWLPDTR